MVHKILEFSKVTLKTDKSYKMLKIENKPNI